MKPKPFWGSSGPPGSGALWPFFLGCKVPILKYHQPPKQGCPDLGKNGSWATKQVDQLGETVRDIKDAYQKVPGSWLGVFVALAWVHEPHISNWMVILNDIDFMAQVRGLQDEEEKKKGMEKWFAEDLPNWCKLAEKSLPAGPGPFMVGGNFVIVG